MTSHCQLHKKRILLSLLSVLDPRYEIPSQHYITETLLPTLHGPWRTFQPSASQLIFGLPVSVHCLSSVKLHSGLMKILLPREQFQGSHSSHALPGAFDDMICRCQAFWNLLFTLFSRTTPKTRSKQLVMLDFLACCVAITPSSLLLTRAFCTTCYSLSMSRSRLWEYLGLNSSLVI